MTVIEAASDAGLGEKPGGQRERKKRNHLSREMIVAEAVAMLTEGPLDALTLRGLAKRLGVGPMSLYTYFSGRDAVLNAAADHVYALFEHPDIGGSWQDYVRDWLWATYRLFQRFPAAANIINVEGRICSAWLKTWLPIAAQLKRNGLDGDHLAFAMDWFGTSTMSFIQAQNNVGESRQPTALNFVSELESDDQQLAVELWSKFRKLETPRVLEFGFEQFVSGLESLVRSANEEKAPTQSASRHADGFLTASSKTASRSPIKFGAFG